MINEKHAFSSFIKCLTKLNGGLFMEILIHMYLRTESGKDTENFRNLVQRKIVWSGKIYYLPDQMTGRSFQLSRGAFETTVLDTSACTRNSFNITNAKNTTLGTRSCSENVLLHLGGVGSRNKLSRWRQKGKIC